MTEESSSRLDQMHVCPSESRSSVPEPPDVPVGFSLLVRARIYKRWMQRGTGRCYSNRLQGEPAHTLVCVCVCVSCATTTIGSFITNALLNGDVFHHMHSHAEIQTKEIIFCIKKLHGYMAVS